MTAVGMSAAAWKSSGFLSMDVQAMSIADTPLGRPFIRCSDVKQCQTDSFEVDGITATRMVKPNLGASKPWEQAWSTECGMFGHKANGAGCDLDIAVMPLYWVMCTKLDGVPYYNAATYNTVRNTCRKVTGFDTTRQCSIITKVYSSPAASPARATDITAATAALNDLINMISRNVQTGDAYINAMSCTVAIYDALQLDPFGFRSMYNAPIVRGLYYFFKHTTVEIPFAMWVKCMVLEGEI